MEEEGNSGDEVIQRYHDMWLTMWRRKEAEVAGVCVCALLFDRQKHTKSCSCRAQNLWNGVCHSRTAINLWKRFQKLSQISQSHVACCCCNCITKQSIEMWDVGWPFAVTLIGIFPYSFMSMAGPSTSPSAELIERYSFSLTTRTREMAMQFIWIIMKIGAQTWIGTHTHKFQ